MPRDNHPRERQARQLARKRPKRLPFDRVLIITEGSKTEPLYLEDIRKQKRIPSAHIAIIPTIGTEPLQIVNYAVQKFEETREFEAIYAVFDRDSHATYNNALNRARALDGKLKNKDKKAVRFYAVPTVPCFELWLLLHYQDLFSFNHRSEVIARVKQHIGGYEKGTAGIYSLTEPHIDGAVSRAVQLRARFSAESGTDPFTNIDELVVRLRSLRD
jgi:hypothetical protein